MAYDPAERVLTVHLGSRSTHRETTVTIVPGTAPADVPVRVPELGVEVAPAPEPEHLWVRAYVRNPWRNPSLAADFSLTPPLGWQATALEQGRRMADGGGVADAWWELAPQDGPTVCGPEVEATAQVTLGSETHTFHGGVPCSPMHTRVRGPSLAHSRTVAAASTLPTRRSRG